MKIEGLGTQKRWTIRGTGFEQATPQNIKIGQELSDENQGWIITDVLGDGKFKAVPKDIYEIAKEQVKIRMQGNENPDFKFTMDNVPNFTSKTETFDISGKVDQSHFVYKLNENAIVKEARRMGLNVEGKVSEDGGTWWKIGVEKGREGMPIEAFAAAPLMFGNNKDKEETKMFSDKRETLKQTFIGTNYDPLDPKQNRPNAKKETIGIGAAGVRMDDTMVASSLKLDGITSNLRLGTVIYVPSLDKKFLVADLMNERFNGENKIDFVTTNSGRKPNPTFNKNFDGIQVIRQGSGRKDARDFVNSGGWDKMKNNKSQGTPSIFGKVKPDN